ncbi:unnamed protein product [Peniophora sp. CBMAI 1063]|nr:unnamed protein product [Peniophora sp. CBMAI 1063]
MPEFILHSPTRPRIINDIHSAGCFAPSQPSSYGAFSEDFCKSSAPPPSPVKRSQAKENVHPAVDAVAVSKALLTFEDKPKRAPLDSFVEHLANHEDTPVTPSSTSRPATPPTSDGPALKEALGALMSFADSLADTAPSSPAKGQEGTFVVSESVKRELLNALLTIAHNDELSSGQKSANQVEGGMEAITSGVAEESVPAAKTVASETSKAAEHEATLAVCAVNDIGAVPLASNAGSTESVLGENFVHFSTDMRTANLRPASPNVTASVIAVTTTPQVLNANGKRPADEDGGMRCYYKHNTVDVNEDIIIQVGDAYEVKHPPREYDIEEIGLTCWGDILPVACVEVENAMAHVKRRTESRKKRCPACF